MALDDPTQKMSKSAENIHSRISLLDEPSKIKKSIMKATTDSEGIVKFDVENKPGISNLMNIYSVLSGKSLDELEKEYDGKAIWRLQKKIWSRSPVALARSKQDMKKSDILTNCLRSSGMALERANAISVKTMKRVKENFGLGL